MIFDAVVLFAIVVSTVIALLRGFIREMLTIVGVVGGLIAAYFAGPHLSPLIQEWLGVGDGTEKERLFGIIPYNMLADFLAYFPVFIAVVFILSVVSHFMAHGAKAVGLGPIDRVLGIVFGFLRAVILIAILYLPFYLLADQETRDGWFADSKSRVYVERISALFAGLLPEDFAEDMEKRAQEAAGSEPVQNTREKLQELDMFLQQSAEGTEEEAGNSGKTTPDSGDGVLKEEEETVE